MKREVWAIAAYLLLLSLCCGAIWHEENEISDYRSALQYNAKMKINYRDSLYDMRKKYDSVIGLLPTIFNHDGILEESHPSRDITGPPTSISLDSDLKISKNQ